MKEKIKDKAKKIFNSLYKKNMLFLLIIAVPLDLIIEMLNRRSVIEGFKFLGSSPIVFLYNVGIIFMTLCIVLMVKRKIFTFSFISILWLIFAIINCVVRGFRMTPFSAIDVLMLKNAISIINKYFSAFQIIIVAFFLIAVVSGIVFLWIKAPKEKEKNNIVVAFGKFAFVSISIIMLTKVGVKAETLSDDWGNLADAYEQYGFAYCFSNSIIDVGISKPSDYSEEAVLNIKNNINRTQFSQKTKEELPNIIFVQLESFFDPYYINGFSCSQNPVREFQYLKDNYSTGLLTVPSIGAGTANTEFEILTGMSTEYFGAGEYPYKTILNSTTCESLCTSLDKYNYSSRAIHNNDGSFYSRNVVFANMGFDAFTPIEYMYNVEYNPLEWAKDDVLVGEVVKSLETTQTKDFIYTITVQSHGRYPSDIIDDTQNLKAFGVDENMQNQFDYYVNQAAQVDLFIKELINEVNKIDEPSIIVFYGDHLPGLDLTDDKLNTIDKYQTEYVIWDNMGLEKVNKNLQSEELSTYVLERLGLAGGIINDFHKTFDESSDYDSMLEMLEYDMLYGEGYVYENEEELKTSNIKFGVEPISVISYTNEEDSIVIKGENFNEFSQAVINNNIVETTYISSNEIIVENKILEPGDNISVAQVSNGNYILDQTYTVVFYQ